MKNVLAERSSGQTSASSDHLSLDGDASLPFGEYLRRHRQGMKLSLRDMAKRLGISHSRLAEFEAGRDNHTGKKLTPSYAMVKLISATYEIPFEQLLVRAGYEPFFTLTEEEAEFLKRFRQTTPEQRMQLDAWLRQALDP